uniref:CCHC-type domain-containing protein n=1 Tax=Strongyloides papillosus TaxID=174720 RepID=A0A0N5BJP2_STREA
MRKETRSSTKGNLFKASNSEKLSESKKFESIVSEATKSVKEAMSSGDSNSTESVQLKELTKIVVALAGQVQELVKIQATAGKQNIPTGNSTQNNAEMARNIVMNEYKSEENFEDWYDKFTTYLDVIKVPEDQRYNYLKLYLTGDALSAAKDYDQTTYKELIEQLKKDHTGGMEKVTARETLRQIKRRRNLRYDDLEKVSKDVEKCCKELLKNKSKDDRVREQIDIMIELLPSNVQQHVEDKEFSEWNHFIVVVKSKYDLERRKKFDDEKSKRVEKIKKPITVKKTEVKEVKKSDVDTIVKTSKPITCNTCGKAGHIAKNCYSNKDNGKTVLLNVKKKES